MIKWALFDKWGYEPHTAQTDGHISDARFRMFIAGTRGGKSLMTGEEGVIYLCAGATRVWVVGQNYSLTEKEFRYIYERFTSPEMHDLFGQTPIESAVYNESQGNMSIRTKWGSNVQCISLERPTGAFGEEVDLIIMSEAAQVKKPRRLYQQLLRGRLASRLGDMIIPTTPAGRTSAHDPDGWLFEMYEKGYDPAEPNYFTREWPSWENPFFPEDPYELRRELDPKIFAEQYEGKFVVFAGAIYTNFAPEIHIINPFKIPKHWNRYEAIDPGFRAEFAWVSAVVSEQGNLYITGEYDDREASYEDRVEAIKNKRCEEYDIPHGMWDVFSRKNNIRTVTYIDPEDPQCAFELTKLGLPCIPANNNVMVGIDRVQRRLKWHPRYGAKLYVTSDCPKVIEAFEFHGWGEKAGELRRPANDRWKHKMDCARYICAGSIVASPQKEILIPESDLWDALVQLQGDAYGRHPHELSGVERRRGL